MRELSLSGFLRTYLRQLSSGGTLALNRLAAQCPDEPRLKEPLFLYALCLGQEGRLLRALPTEELRAEFAALAGSYNQCTMELALQFGAEELPPGYQKLYHSYQSRRDGVSNDNHSKYLMREHILRMQAEQGVSNYRIYTDLNLNPGNVNAFLKHGDCGKVSLAVARKILTYMKNSLQP